MWCREAFYGLGVQGVEFLIFLGALFLPTVAPVSQQDFDIMEFTLSSSAPWSPSWIPSFLISDGSIFKNFNRYNFIQRILF
jgi:hypothetical protein